MNKLLFICGFPSGGTDLVRSILNSHPEIHISGEMLWLKDIVKYGYDQNMTFTNMDEIHAFQFLLKKWDRWRRLENLFFDFSPLFREKSHFSLEEVIKIMFSGENKKVWGNKTPQNTENIDVLLELFPRAYFLVVTRDVRDVCLSWKKKWGKSDLLCATKWAGRMAKGKRFTDNFPQDRYLYIKFEDLLSDTEKACLEICSFLNVPFSSRMLEPHKHTNKIIGGKINYGQPIKSDNYKKWKTELHPRFVKRIEELAFNTMKMFKYKMHYATKYRPILFWEKLYGHLYDAYAMLIIGNRYSSNNSISNRLKEIRN